MLPQAEPFCSGANVRFTPLLRRFCYVNGSGSWGDGPGAGVPASAGSGHTRLKPGRLGRGPVAQGTPHAVGPTRIIFSDRLLERYGTD